MTNLKTSIFHSKTLRFALMLLALFSGSVLGGAIFAYITKPKEACAQCMQVGLVAGDIVHKATQNCNNCYVEDRCPDGYAQIGSSHSTSTWYENYLICQRVAP
ncbi:MAG: hypothetical protein HZC18_07860 [Candidatus Omnitrophica bacterium]|nr:hypothetical protein [Candidatus Omnitrophota bacterium]